MKKSLTPHGPGFSFVDAVSPWDGGDRLEASFRLDPELPFFRDHFPGNPLMPGVLMIEAAAQAAGILWAKARGEGEGARPCYLAQTGPFRFFRPARPGETLGIAIRLEREMEGAALFSAEIGIGTEKVAAGSLTLALVPDRPAAPSR